MTGCRYEARTIYGVLIARAFADRKHALTWAADHGDEYPGCRIIMLTKAGPRTIWRHEPERVAA